MWNLITCFQKYTSLTNKNAWSYLSCLKWRGIFTNIYPCINMDLRAVVYSSAIIYVCRYILILVLHRENIKFSYIYLYWYMFSFINISIHIKGKDVFNEWARFVLFHFWLPQGRCACARRIQSDYWLTAKKCLWVSVTKEMRVRWLYFGRDEYLGRFQWS